MILSIYLWLCLCIHVVYEAFSFQSSSLKATESCSYFGQNYRFFFFVFLFQPNHWLHNKNSLYMFLFFCLKSFLWQTQYATEFCLERKETIYIWIERNWKLFFQQEDHFCTWNIFNHDLWHPIIYFKMENTKHFM